MTISNFRQTFCDGPNRHLRDLYKFDGSHPARWLAQMEQSFNRNNILDNETQLMVASMYLDNERRQWWQEHQCSNRRFWNWDIFTKTIMDHFGRKTNLVDKLTQTDTLPSKYFIFTEKKETMEPKGLFSTDVSLLQVHGLI